MKNYEEYDDILIVDDRETKLELVRLWYVYEHLTKTEIARRLQVSSASVGNWIKNKGWEQQKKHFKTISDNILLIRFNLVKQITDYSLNEDFDWDKIDKMINTLNKVQVNSIPISSKIAICTEIINSIKNESETTKKIVISTIEKYVSELKSCKNER